VELAFIKPQENILVRILLTVFSMKRLGKRITLFRNIKAGRNFAVDITPLAWAGEISIKEECCGDRSNLNPRYVLLLDPFIDGKSKSSRKTLNTSAPVKFWDTGLFCLPRTDLCRSFSVCCFGILANVFNSSYV